MADRAIPNLPSRSFDATAEFYGALGFETTFRRDDWMAMRRGALELEFFPFPTLDPYRSNAMCTLRVADLDALCRAALAAGVPAARTGIPRVVAPRDEDWARVAWIVDADGTQLNLVQEA